MNYKLETSLKELNQNSDLNSILILLFGEKS